MDLGPRLAQLQDVLITSTDLSAIWTDFFNFTDDCEVFEQSEKTTLPTVKRIIHAILAHLFQEQIPIDAFCPLKLKGHPFYHGLCWAKGIAMSYVYFSDIDLGILAIPKGLHTPNTDMIRFTITDQSKVQH